MRKIKNHKKEIKTLTRQEILLRGKPLPDAEVFIQALNGNITLTNVEFSRLCDIRMEAPDAHEYNIAEVAEFVKELDIEDVRELQKNAGVFAEIFAAVKRYQGGGFSDNEIKN